MATDEECMAYAREGVRLAGLTDEPKIRFWRTSALRAVTATAGTSRWRPRGSSRARTRHRMVEVKDLQSGDVTAAALRPG
jgi:hypothetical protein